MNLTPRKAFLLSKSAKEHVDLVERESFRDALQTALLEYMRSLPNNPDATASAFAHHRFRGAMEFVDVLLNLTEPFVPPKPDLKQNLTPTK